MPKKTNPPQAILWVPTRNLIESEKFYRVLAKLLKWKELKNQDPSAPSLYTKFIPGGNPNNAIQIILHLVPKLTRGNKVGSIVSFTVKNLTPLLRRCKTKAFNPALVAHEEFSHGQILRLRDPDNNLIEFFEPRSLPAKP